MDGTRGERIEGLEIQRGDLVRNQRSRSCITSTPLLSPNNGSSFNWQRVNDWQVAFEASWNLRTQNHRFKEAPTKEEESYLEPMKISLISVIR